MMIVVCGLSKCGKSSLIKRASKSGLAVPSVKASQLLRTSGRPTQTLNAAEALKNQPELSNLLKQHVHGGQPIILDGHLLIETIDGPQLVPETGLVPLGVIGIILVTAPKETIASRRAETKFTTNIEDIQDLATIECVHARRFARMQGVPFSQIDYLDVSDFVGAVKNAIKIAGAAHL